MSLSILEVFIMKRALLASVLVFALAPAHSAMTLVTNSPAAWRLESYPGGAGVVVWFTSSPCPNGQVTFSSTASQADVSRFWATVSIAKAAGKKIFLYFDNTSAPASCPIVSFGLDSE
jgi:hypothetical protein